MEQLRVYHLQTHKVASINKKDSMPVIESILVKLTSILSLKKYCLFLTQERVIEKNPPKITKVLIDGKDAGEDEMRTAQATMDEILKPAEKKLSYKEAFEDQEKKTIELEKRLQALEVPKLEMIDSSDLELRKAEDDKRKEMLRAKATELNIAFRSNLGDEKLLLKIQEIEPEYKI